MPCRKKKRIKRANKKKMHKHLPNELLYEICEALKLVERRTAHIGRTENVKKSCRVLNNYLEARARKMRKRMLQLLAENCWDTSNQRGLYSHNNLAITFLPKPGAKKYIEDKERTAHLHEWAGWRAPLYIGDVLARHPFPKFKCGVFYFEILVNRIMSDEGIGIGLKVKSYCEPVSCLLKSNGNFWRCRTFGSRWDSDDDQYSSEEDEYFGGANKQKHHYYGFWNKDEDFEKEEKMENVSVCEKKSEENGRQNCSFGPGDVVGCGLEMATHRLFFTRNGINLGSPKTDVKLDGSITAYDDEEDDDDDVVVKIFPMVRLNAKDDAVIANFGRTEFVYRFDD